MSKSNTTNLINKRSKNTKKTNNILILYCCLSSCIFSIIWAILYYFFAIPPCLIPAQFLCGYILLLKHKKSNLKIILPTILCSVLNCFALYTSILIGLYAEVGNWGDAFKNIILLFNNSPLFKANVLLQCCYIFGITILCLCLSFAVLAIIKVATRPKSISVKKLESNIPTDHFIQLFLATKNAISKFSEDKNAYEFKKSIYDIDQQLANLSKNEITEIKQRIADSNSFSSLSTENKKALNIIQKLADKY